MSDQERKREARRVGGNGASAVLHEGGEGAVANARHRQEQRPVSKDARSRRFLADRLNSSRNYAHFAGAAAGDIFDGEPLDRFAAVGKLDERVLRMRAQELREDIFADAMKARPVGITGSEAAKQVTG